MALFGEKYGDRGPRGRGGRLLPRAVRRHPRRPRQPGSAGAWGRRGLDRGHLRRIEALTGPRRCTTSTVSASSRLRWRPCSRPGPRTPPSSCGGGWRRQPTPSASWSARAWPGSERLAIELAGRVAMRPTTGWLVVERVPGRPVAATTRAGSPARSATGVGAGPGVVVPGSEAQGVQAMVALLTADLADPGGGQGRPGTGG